jgi:transposase-like protein
MTLPDLIELFGTDEKCRELLERLRWPNGPECPRCKSDDVVRLETNTKLLWCPVCEYQFGVTVGSIFHDSHLPLNIWFMATLLLCEAKKGMSALQLKRTIWGQHKGSYKTAWYLCHRIRAAMKEAEQPMLDGTVEMDETYVGGKPRVGRPAREKDIVIGLRQRGGDVRFLYAKDVKADTIYKIIAENVSEDVEVLITDEHPVYPFAMGSKKDRHKTIRHKDTYVVGDIHTNTVESAFSLLKRGIFGTWHRISTKHLPAYLNEMSFRFNRRKDQNLFLDTLRHMITAPVLTFEKLTA